MANFDAMQMTAAEFAAAIKKMDQDDRQNYLRERDNRDLTNLGFSDHDIAVSRAWASLTPEERAKLAPVKDLAREEANRRLKAEGEKFLDGLRKKYSAA